MKLTTITGTLLLGLGWLGTGLLARAQVYSLPWYRVAGGGGMSSGGSYAIKGTVGQAEAGPKLAGGAYAVTGGFWSVISAIQTAGLPNLVVTHAGKTVTISWASTGSYTLWQTPALSGASWSQSSYPVTTTNGLSSITISSATGNLFFRLSNP